MPVIQLYFVTPVNHAVRQKRQQFRFKPCPLLRQFLLQILNCVRISTLNTPLFLSKESFSRFQPEKASACVNRRSSISFFSESSIGGRISIRERGNLRGGRRRRGRGITSSMLTCITQMMAAVIIDFNPFTTACGSAVFLHKFKFNTRNYPQQANQTNSC